MTDPFQISRRQMLMGGLAATAGTSLGLDVRPALAACAPVARVLEPKPERAVSLKAMSRALAKGPSGNPNYANLLRMGGITRLDGYVSDEAANDLILFGIVERDAPPLDFRDFVVALRNSHFRYGRVRDNDAYNMQPAISIDFDPVAWRDLDVKKFDFLKGSKTRQEQQRQAYVELCSTPQTVRVEGMPRACRAAKILVDADYLMKKVNVGTHTIPMASPIVGSSMAGWQDFLSRTAQGKKPLPTSGMRYWFEAKSFKYADDEEIGATFLTTAQVVLLNKPHGYVDGKLDDIEAEDAYSREFACSWTARMEETYRAEPIWRDMHNIFRHFAIAGIIAEKRVLANVEFDDKTLLQDFETRTPGPPDTVEGVSVIRFDKVKRTSWASAYCGGVSAGFHKENLQVDTTANLEQTKRGGQSVLASRPADEMQVAWNVDPSAILKPRSRPVAPAKATPPTPTPSVNPTPPARKPTIEEIMKRRT